MERDLAMQGGSVWLSFLPAAIIVMASAVRVICREAPNARSHAQKCVLATSVCRRATISGLVLAPTGLHFVGPSWPLGVLVIAIGLLVALGAAAAAEHYRVLID
jgi:hypothetical protein